LEHFNDRLDEAHTCEGADGYVNPVSNGDRHPGRRIDVGTGSE